MRTLSGWTAPKMIDGKPVEGTWRAHQAPIADFDYLEHIVQLEHWMLSYRAEELSDATRKFRDEYALLTPTGLSRLGSSPHTNDGELSNLSTMCCDLSRSADESGYPTSSFSSRQSADWHRSASMACWSAPSRPLPVLAGPVELISNVKLERGQLDSAESSLRQKSVDDDLVYYRYRSKPSAAMVFKHSRRAA